jgi:hypothetical protein
MNPRILSFFSLAIAVNACVDQGVIGEGTAGAAGTHSGGSSTVNDTGGSSALVTTGGTSSAGSGGQSNVLDLASATLTRCGMVSASDPVIGSLSIPSDVQTAEPQALWADMFDACTEGGWDLLQCAGEDVTVVSSVIDTNVAYQESLNTLVKGDKVCCAYVTANAPGGHIPARCGPKTVATAVVNDCAIPNDGTFTVQQIDLPTSLTGPNWGIKSSACAEGGWDLSLCAGSTATFSAFNMGNGSDPNGPTTAWVVTRDSTVCCLYESGNGNPGIYSVACSR